MRKILIFVITIAVYCNLLSQTPISYRFRKPTSVNATTWKFSNVAPLTDAIVTVTGSKNATINMIDDSANYAYAWQPRINYTNTMSSSSDSSYVEFTVRFVNSTLGTPSIQALLAMTLVDLDGSSSPSYREMVKTSLPASSKGITGSLITSSQDSKWLTSMGPTTSFASIDTSVYKAMVQVNMAAVSSFVIRVGVLGPVPANTVRYHSMYFKPFSAMSVPLSVKLSHFSGVLNHNNSELAWSTASEENLDRFEIERSVDNKHFFPLGSVNAMVHSQEMTDYNYTDADITGISGPFVYYRLKMIDNEGNYKLSNIIQIRVSSSLSSSISIYPNPATDFVNVTLNETFDSESTISISDIQGKSVLANCPQTGFDNNLSFDIRNLVNGIYFINIQNIDGTITSGKFIKR